MGEGVLESGWEWCSYGYKNFWISRKKARPVDESDPMASASVSSTAGSVQKAEMSSQAKGGNSLMNFGEYKDWAYAAIPRGKPNCASYICTESADSSEAHRQFRECAALKEDEYQADGRVCNSRRN